MQRNTLLSIAALALANSAGINSDPLVASNPYGGAWRRSYTRPALSAPIIGGYKGAGTTMAQQKRMAKKRKNRARHKLAMKRR